MSSAFPASRGSNRSARQDAVQERVAESAVGIGAVNQLGEVGQAGIHLPDPLGWDGEDLAQVRTRAELLQPLLKYRKGLRHRVLVFVPGEVEAERVPAGGGAEPQLV